MRKSILAAASFLLFAPAMALADGQLESDKVDGYFKYCYYSDGGALTVSNDNQCPPSNRGLAGQVDLQDTYPPGKLASEEIRGKFKYCHYYGGASLPIQPTDACPPNNN